MSDYAAAINQALGQLPQQPVLQPRRIDQSQERATVSRVPTTPKTKKEPALIAFSEVYRDFLIVVRERPGVASISEPPPGHSYWSVYFTDDELLLEKEGGTIEQRAQACRNAIDRLLLGTPVWTGAWWKRAV